MLRTHTHTTLRVQGGLAGGCSPQSVARRVSESHQVFQQPVCDSSFCRTSALQVLQTTLVVSLILANLGLD